MKKIGNTKTQAQTFTIGGDPELMLARANGEIVSSIPVLKRDKNNPICLDKDRAINLYADNSLCEVSFKPSHNKYDFVNSYRTAFQKAQKYLGKDYRLLVKSAHYFKENELEEAYGIDPKQIGCNPEYDFYEEKIRHLGEFKNTMRSGSSHIHCGSPKIVEYHMRHNALKILEIYLGCSSILWDNDESSKTRRMCYGKSGSFRPTDYGFEIRCPSNYMLNSPSLVELAYDLVEYSLSHIFNNTYKNILDSINSKDVQDAINNCDKIKAEQILVKAKLPKELFKRVKSESKKKYSTAEFYKNWDIKV